MLNSCSSLVVVSSIFFETVWQPINEIKNKLLDDKSINNQVYKSIINLIKIRKKQPAFHPNAIQFTFNLGKNFFGIWRQSIDRSQNIFAITNISSVTINLKLSKINLFEN